MDDTPDARKWCEKALQAVFCLWDHDRKQAWRGSQEHAKSQKPNAKEQLRPTVTFNAVMAFGDCGLFQKDLRYVGNTVEVRPLQMKVEGVRQPLNGDDILRKFLDTDRWVDDALDSSEHGRIPPAMELAPRASIMLGRMLPAIHLLSRHVELTVLKELQDKLLAGMRRIAECFTTQLFPNPVELFDETPSEKPATISPQIVMYGAMALDQWMRLTVYLEHRERNLTDAEKDLLRDFEARHPATNSLEFAVTTELRSDLRDKVLALLATFRAYFARQVDRQMARKHVPLDPDYDCASLAFALNGLALLDERIRATQFFRTCVAAVVEGQNPDGCWPEGITVASHESSDVAPVRQPSVEIALTLAESVFRRSCLFRCQTHEAALLEMLVPALQRQLRYLAASFQALSNGYSGWADDRLRAPGEVRMQVNAMAARLINFIRLSEIACVRAKILDRYKPEWPVSEPWRDGKESEKLWEEVIDPDQITRPCRFLLSDVIKPLADQMRAGHFFLRPAKHGVSAILYGPPGSGKTFVVSRFADALGWPLISLNPGYFIEKGLELFEAVAGTIFADLMKLDHAVVFFDECDELFRDRKTRRKAREISSPSRPRVCSQSSRGSMTREKLSSSLAPTS